MVHTFNPRTQRQRLMDVCGLKAQPGQHSEFQNNQGYIEGLCHKTQDGKEREREEKKTDRYDTRGRDGCDVNTLGTLRRYPSHSSSKGLWPSRHLDFLLSAIRL